ncbi:unnamed protein product, partial [Iphiclides podalirius]
METCFRVGKKKNQARSITTDLGMLTLLRRPNREGRAVRGSNAISRGERVAVSTHRAPYHGHETIPTAWQIELLHTTTVTVTRRSR